MTEPLVLVTQTFSAAISLLVMVQIFQQGWRIDDRLQRRFFQFFLFFVFLVIALGQAALGFLIGLAVGGIQGSLAGGVIVVTTGVLVEGFPERANQMPGAKKTLRLLIAGLIGVVLGVLAGLSAIPMGGASNLEGGLIGLLAGIITAIHCALKMTETENNLVRIESDSLEGVATGMITGAMVGAMVGTILISRVTIFHGGMGVLVFLLKMWLS